MDIRRLLTYTDNCRLLLQSTLAAHPDVFDKPFETLSDFSSLHALVAHCIGAEQRWIEKRLHGKTPTTRYEAHSVGTIEGLFADWERVRARTRAALTEAHDPSHPASLHTEMAFTLMGQPYSDILTVEEIFFHVFNHQVYHLGQISMALQRFGIDPPGFDYPLLHRDDEVDE